MTPKRSVGRVTCGAARTAVDPLGQEVRYHSVARTEPAPAVADDLHHPRHVGRRHEGEAQRQAHAMLDHREIARVQGDRRHPYEKLTRPW